MDWSIIDDKCFCTNLNTNEHLSGSTTFQPYQSLKGNIERIEPLFDIGTVGIIFTSGLYGRLIIAFLALCV